MKYQYYLQQALILLHVLQTESEIMCLMKVKKAKFSHNILSLGPIFIKDLSRKVKLS